MSDAEDEHMEGEEQDENDVPEQDEKKDDQLHTPRSTGTAASALKSPTPGRTTGFSVSETVLRKQQQYSAGKPSKHDKNKLMRSEGIIPIQAGSNKYASQKGMTGFGVPRDVIDKVKSDNLAEITDEKKIEALKASTWLQSGTNKFASQKGQTGFGSPRDVNYKTKGTGGASEVSEEKARASDGIVPLQSGTNKLASQAGMTGIGMPRIVDVRKAEEQDRESQGFIHLQMGTNRFANQSGMTGFGMPRHNITSKYKDEVRGEMPHDEGTTSRQTSGWREELEGTFHSRGMGGAEHKAGMIPYQMGVNFLESQAGKTGFGMPRQVYTAFVDDTHEDLPADMARRPEVPFWTGQDEARHANQTGMGAFGTPRDVRGEYVRRMW
ncbi:calponin family repeat-containing domain protein [Cooperia oncophora]